MKYSQSARWPVRPSVSRSRSAGTFSTGGGEFSHQFPARKQPDKRRGHKESGLFGHRKWAFSGADRDHPGLFQQADEGTLFLDEIGELSLDCQARLLRVIEGKAFRPVGATSDINPTSPSAFGSSPTPRRRSNTSSTSRRPRRSRSRTIRCMSHAMSRSWVR